MTINTFVIIIALVAIASLPFYFIIFITYCIVNHKPFKLPDVIRTIYNASNIDISDILYRDTGKKSNVISRSEIQKMIMDIYFLKKEIPNLIVSINKVKAHIVAKNAEDITFLTETEKIIFRLDLEHMKKVIEISILSLDVKERELFCLEINWKSVESFYF